MKKQKRVYRQELLLSENTKLELKRLCESADCDTVPIVLSHCLEEADSLKQCTLLKKIESLLQVAKGTKLQCNSICKCLAVLAEMFLACDIRNPARKVISSIFESLPRDWTSGVLSCMVLNKISQTRDILILGGDVWIRCSVDMISDLLECFTLGTDVLLFNGHFVLEFLGLCLNRQRKVPSVESSPTLQTSSMLDCLATIQAIISFLQKSNSEQRLCNLFDKMAFCCIETKNVDDDGSGCGITYQAVHETKRSWKELMKQIFFDLCAVLFDDHFIPDCQTAAGMGILVVIKVMCPAENVVSTVGQLLFPSHTKYGNRAFSIFSDPQIVSVFQTGKGCASFSHLCLCRGVLAMIPIQFLVQSSEIILNKEKKSGTLMFDALFPDLCCLCDSQREPSRSLLAFRTLTLWASQAREIAMSYSCTESWIKDELYGTSPIPTKLLNYVWTHWDHPVEGVRYQTRTICEQVVKLHLLVSQFETSKESFLRDLTASLLKVSSHVKGKYGPLCCITSVVGATKMLLWFPKLPHDIFPLMKDRCLVSHVMEFIEKMASSHKQEISDAGQDIKGWMKTWIVPLLYHLRHGCRVMREHLTQRCLPKFFKCCPESLQFIVEDLEDNYEQKPGDLGTLITCLKTARCSGVMSFYKNTYGMVAPKATPYWCGVVPVQLMRKALCHLDNQIRLDALGLLCDSPRTTESVTEVDLQLLQLFIAPNMNNQAPSFRQQVGAHLKKFLLRMKEGIRISSRTIKQKGKDNEKQFYHHRLALYKEFLLWFCASQFDALFPGASFARRSSALHGLTLIKEIFSCEESSDSATMGFQINDVMTEDNIYILLDCLGDSYEVNKLLAYDILWATPSELLPFQEEKVLLGWLNMIDRLVSSPRAADASTAATLLKLLVEKCSLPLTFEMDEKKQDNEHLSTVMKSASCNCKQAFRVLNYLVTLLGSHCLAASKNLYVTGIQAPMHSVLYCIRAILGHMSFRNISGNEQWKNLISSLLNECLCAADLADPVVTSSSPEGFLMDDYEEVDQYFSQVPQYSVLEEGQMMAPASQVLLVCCWRTMKEVALLLGELAENAPIQVCDSKHGLLTPEQLGNIGGFFTKVLLTSKHRGTFELAYTGFAKLSAVLWRNTDTDLRQLPEHWLWTLLQDLGSAIPSETLCGTRRSAGVPFFIQAIVTTQPSASGWACFKQVMIELLQIASRPTKDVSICDSTLPQVHASNILRALYRETKVGEIVFPFVSNGVVVAINGFHSDSWAVRNSSMLLFSALVTRIFGVKQGRDEHSRKNCMTGREFFSRFPELHSFFLGHLQVACQGIDRDNTIHASLYPVLVILSRLYPSSMDGVDTVLSMEMFLPYVISCRKSMVMKTRIMSARAVVPLVAEDLLVQTLCKLLFSLPVSSSDEQRQNQIHGTLNHIYYLLRGHAVDSTMSATVKMQIVTDILPQLKHYSWLCTRSNPCALSQSVFLDIVFQFVLDQTWLADMPDVAKSDFHDLKQWFNSIIIQEMITKQEPSIFIGHVFVKRTLAKSFLRACEDLPSAITSQSHLAIFKQVSSDFQGSKENSETTVNCFEVIQTLLQSSEHEVRLDVLEFIFSHLPSDKHTSSGREAISEEDALRNSTGSWKFEKIEGKLKSQLFTAALKMEHHTECLEKVFQVLYRLTDVLSFPWMLSSGDQVLYSECWKFVTNLMNSPYQRDTLKCALLCFLSRMVSLMHGMTSNKDMNIALESVQALVEFSNITLQTSSPAESVEVRLCTAQVLGHTSVTDVMVDFQEKLDAVHFHLWSVVIKLLQDEEPLVREQMVEAFSTLLKGIHNSTLVSALTFGDFAVVPPLTLESAMFCVWFLYIEREPVECILWMLKWIWGDMLCSCNPDEDNGISDVDRLFERGPLNIYNEDLIVIDVAWKTVKTGIEMNDGYALLKLQQNRVEIIELLNKHLEECIVFLESLLLIDYNVNKDLFSHFYRSFVGISVIIMLTEKLEENISPLQSRIMAILHAVKTLPDMGGSLLHPKLQDPLKELSCKINLLK